MTDADDDQIVDAAATASMGERDFPQVRTGDERTMLTSMLDWYRVGVVSKLAGLDQVGASRRLVASDTTIGGLVYHLALVEDSWFHQRFAGNDIGEPWSGVDWDATPNWEFENAHLLTVDELREGYEAACERSRQAVGDRSLDEMSASTDGVFTLRWALVHMLEETARHLGHLDILREITDGVTGE
ncbi:MAG: DinB family protein [Acidimicrobiia bacterium]